LNASNFGFLGLVGCFAIPAVTIVRTLIAKCSDIAI
jgi:hypothetical protein